ncbi:SH2 motif and Tyrosine protein kinase domain containing protein [Aphelenchoides besseyi]|nr:SH2 motif and Tyrosine protein kinase domain containing protein [Aphelenchoides besseyi]
MSGSRTAPRGNSTSTTGRNNLEKEEWYHGLLPREDITTLLTIQGQFLVRLTEPKAGQGKKMVLSVRWNNRVHHLIINENDSFFYIEHFKFSSVSDLIGHYMRTGKPVTEKSGAVLLTPVLRQDWELKHEQLDLGKTLGEGAFGEVRVGTLTQGKKKIKVAIKIHKGTNLSKEMIKEMCKEARIMRRYEHPNIVRFYGVAMEKEPLMLVMELVDGGSLDKYLNKNGPKLTTNERTRMCLDAAKGLEYLHDKGCIHRDLSF